MSNMPAIETAVPHRERVAWLSLIAMAVTFGPYFTLTVLWPPSAPLPALPALLRFGVTTVAQLLILGGGRLWLRLRFPEDARAAADERDRAVTRRAQSVAYFVLIGGMIVVGIVMPFQSSGWKLVNSAIFMIVLAEVVHYGVAICGYRRGWHD